jgi:hypothetical protein
VQLVSVLIVAVDEGRDFRLCLFALVPFLVEIFAAEISPGNDLKYSLGVEV